MRRVTLALSILLLACALAHLAVAQGTTPKVLWQPDLTKGNPLVGVGPAGAAAEPYREAVNGAGDQTALKDAATAGAVQVAPFLVITDTTDTRFQWLDGGDSTNVGQGDGYDDTAATGATSPWLLLTGDPAWTDVSITSRAIMWNQNTGALSLILRAAPKTKVSDPNSYYALQLTVGNSNVLASMTRDGIIQPNDTSTNDDGSAEGCTLRILKRVNGKWTQLAETNQDKTTVKIPRINNLGHDHDVSNGVTGTTSALTGGYFQFVAKGTTLTGNVSLDGKTFTKVIEATDAATDALKAGLVGFSSYDIEPCFRDIVVTDVPATTP
jgi:hypothetical protein